MEESLPRPFGRYRLTGILGHGGMASVYRAESEPVAGVVRSVAIKRMLQRSGGGETDMQALVDEARIWVRLHHPNIVGVVDFGEVDGDLFLALEIVEGLSASTLVAQSSPLSPAEALLVVERVARALAHAHALRDEAGRSLRVVHRDVKPSNILVSRDGEVKLTDFGIARATIRDSSTEAGFVKGSLGYLSPEQVRGEELDGRSDLFSLGCTMYALVTGKVPLPPGKSRELVMQKIAKGETLPPPDFLAPRFRELLGSLMAPSLPERPATAEDVVKRVRALLEEDADDLQRALGDRVRRALETPAPANVVVVGAASDVPTFDPAPGAGTETAAPPPVLATAVDPGATDILPGRTPAVAISATTGSTPGPVEPLFPPSARSAAAMADPDGEQSSVGPAAPPAEPLFPALEKRGLLRVPREAAILGVIGIGVIAGAVLLGNTIASGGFARPTPYSSVPTPRSSLAARTPAPTPSVTELAAITPDPRATPVPAPTRVAILPKDTRASQALSAARSLAAGGKYERAIEILYLEALRDHPPAVSEELLYHVCLYSSKLHGLSSSDQIRARYERYLQRFPNAARASAVREWARSLD